MAIRIVRLGSARAHDEGLRIGTVRRPPRGVPKSAYASQDWYDVWCPILSPRPQTMKLAQKARTAQEWSRFVKRYKAEMRAPDAAHTLELLAALSRRTEFSVGCYCADESRCHRSVLRSLLAEKGAKLA